MASTNKTRELVLTSRSRSPWQTRATKRQRKNSSRTCRSSSLTLRVVSSIISSLLCVRARRSRSLSSSTFATIPPCFFCPRDDRVTIVFSLDFNERVDKEIAKIFLQEFVDTRKKIGRAPPTAYSANPPNELRDDFGISENTKGTLGYISFAVLKSHLDKGKK